MFSKSKNFNFSNVKERLPFLLFILFILWFTFTFLIFPNINVFKDTFIIDGEFSTRSIERLMSSQRAKTAVFNSFVLAFVLNITVNIVGTFNVLVTDYFDIKGARFLKIGFLSTLVFSGMILNNGYLYLYGNGGVLTNLLTAVFPNMPSNWFTGFPAVLFVMTFACTTNHMLFLSSGIKSLDFNTIEAAKNLGASQFQVLRQIVLPSLKPIFITLVVMTVQLGLAAFSAPIMVGGEWESISPLILRFTQRPSSRDLAALLSIILGIVQIFLLFILTRAEKKGNYMSVAKTKTRVVKQKIENPIINIIVHVISYVLLAIYTLPIILVTIFSFMEVRAINQGTLSFAYFTLDNYKEVLTNSSNYQPLLTSVIYSLGAAIIAVIFMTLVARLIMKNRNKIWSDITEQVFYIPWLLPPLMMAIGILISYGSPSPLLFNISVIGSVWVLPLMYLIVMLPQSLRYMKSAFYSFDSNLEDASRNLGASNFKTFIKIVLPSLMPTALALVSLNFTRFLADYDLSAFLYHPNFPTIGIVIESNTNIVDNLNGPAINLVYSVLVIIVSSILVYFIYGRGNVVSKKRGGIKE